MRLFGSIAALTVFSALVTALPGLMRGQQCSAKGEVTIPCQGSGFCFSTTVLNDARPGGNFGQTQTTVYCGNADCTATYFAANGTCYAAALNKPNILDDLDRLSRKSPIPILVASCTGGLVEYRPNERVDTKAPRLLNVDTQILKESISHKYQRPAGSNQ